MLFALRALLALGLVFGLAPRSAPAALPPGLAMAMAAGALCLGDGPTGLPSGHVHDTCGTCLGTAAGMAAAPASIVPVRVAGRERRAPALVALLTVGSGAAYSSRAPPG